MKQVGFEPTTFGTSTRHSTPELLFHYRYDFLLSRRVLRGTHQRNINIQYSIRLTDDERLAVYRRYLDLAVSRANHHNLFHFSTKIPASIFIGRAYKCYRISEQSTDHSKPIPLNR